MTATKYVAALRNGLKEAIEVIEALDSMTRRGQNFEAEVLRPLRKVLKQKISACPACGKTRKLAFHCPQHE